MTLATRTFILPLEAVPKPRQTQADRWRDRPAVQRYRVYADRLRSLARREGLELPEVFTVRFYLSMPRSWSRKRRQLNEGAPHNQSGRGPDWDNLAKGFVDALVQNDARIWKVATEKYYSARPRIVVITYRSVPDTTSISCPGCGARLTTANQDEEIIPAHEQR